MNAAQQMADTLPPPAWHATWTKQCKRCEAVYDAEGWAALPCIGRQTFDYGNGERTTLEMRNCPCKGTLAVDVEEMP